MFHRINILVITSTTYQGSNEQLRGRVSPKAAQSCSGQRCGSTYVGTISFQDPETVCHTCLGIQYVLIVVLSVCIEKARNEKTNTFENEKCIEQRKNNVFYTKQKS